MAYVLPSSILFSVVKSFASRNLFPTVSISAKISLRQRAGGGSRKATRLPAGVTAMRSPPTGRA